MTEKIVVTDSGLGGISVMSEIENGLIKSEDSDNIELYFYNAFAGEGFGYNQIKDKDKKVELFDAVLNKIDRDIQPDKILIACNTLSVVYNEFLKNRYEDVEILDIVNFGITEILQNYNGNNSIIILGTPTTVNSNQYHNYLVERGLSPEHIYSKDCPDLESVIQQDAFGKDTKKMIRKYLSEIYQNKELHNKENLICLCCTHYGYAEDLFNKVLNELNINFKIINPNKAMSESIIKSNTCENVSAKVLTKNYLKEVDIENICKIIESRAPQTSSALRNFHFDENLFQIPWE